MQTHLERAHPVTGDHLAALDLATKLVAKISPRRGDEVRCHELARAVHRCLGGLRTAVADGYLGFVEHSWLELPGRLVLDVYAPGRLPQVQLVSTHSSVAVFRRSTTRTDVSQSLIASLVAEMDGELELSCTPHAHYWAPGARACTCGEASREGQCVGFRVESRLSDDEIVRRFR